MFVISKPKLSVIFPSISYKYDNHGKNSYKIFGQNIYIGLDTHFDHTSRRYILQDLSQDPKAEVLSRYLQEHFPGGHYYSQVFGFKAHRELTKLGINNMVVNPADIPTTDNRLSKKKMLETAVR